MFLLLLFTDQDKYKFNTASSATTTTTTSTPTTATTTAAIVSWSERTTSHTDQQDQIPWTTSHQEGQTTELFQVQHQQEPRIAETTTS